MISFLQKMVVNIADDSQTPTLEGIIGLDLLAQTIENDTSQGPTIIEQIFHTHELQSLKKICLQQGENQRAGLEKVSTYLMKLLALKNPAIRHQFSEDAKNQSEDDSAKWNQILSGDSDSKTGVQWREKSSDIRKQSEIANHFTLDPTRELTWFIEG